MGINILDHENPPSESTTLFLKALADQAARTQCVECNEIEWVLPIDDDAPLDDLFLANYLCDDCENAAE